MLIWSHKKRLLVMRLKVATSLLIVLVLTVILMVNVFPFRGLCETGSRVHNLDTGLTYASIQEAIRANETSNGHTILVEAGFYYENVVVDKSVTLIPEGFGVIIDGGGNGTIFNVVADNVNITGFIIQNSGMETHRFGILLNRTSGCVITENIIRNAYYGIRVNYAHDNLIRYNNLHNCTYGIWLSYSERNILFDNYAFNNYQVGFHLYPASNNVLGRNEAWNNEHGIYIYNSRGNTVEENRVSNNTSGIWVSGSANNTLRDNEAYDNVYGIRLGTCSSNSVSGNFLEGNDFGVSLRNSKDNSVFHNNFLNNAKQKSTDNSADIFDNGIEGNYWSDYDGVDGDNDGIGDTPYIIDENKTDRYPLMGEFFGFSEVSDMGEHEFYIISNCLVSDFEFSSESQMFKFRVSDSNGTSRFCRAMFPRMVLASPYIAIVDGVEVDAALLAVSNISHVFLHFLFNMSSHEVMVSSRPFYELSQEYNTLMNDYNDLIANHNNLWDNYLSLNASYNDAKSSLESLQAMFDTLNLTYNGLVVKYETVKAELGQVKLLMYGFLGATVAVVVVSIVSLGFGLKYYRRFGEQRRIIEAYGVSPLEVARALFELDVKKRGEKIERFEEKYGVKIKPRGSLEDIIKNLKSKKKKRRS